MPKKESKLTREQWLEQERTLLSNERTFLAYIRTALTAIVFGLALMQFGKDNPALVKIGASAIFTGIAICLIGLIHFSIHKKMIRQRD